MYKNIALMTTLALGCLLTACDNQSGPTQSVDARVAQARARNDGPAIWKVSDYDSERYLFGPLHLFHEAVDWLNDE